MATKEAPTPGTTAGDDVTPSQIRRRLKRVGSKRERVQRAMDDLQRDTIEALELAEGVISTTEAAKLIGLSRSTVYEVYRGGRESRKGKREGG